MASQIDPVGVAGTALGATSLLAQVFEGTVKAIQLWRKAGGIGEDAAVFQTRLELQLARFKSWGIDWGIDRGPAGLHVKDRRFKDHGDTAIKYVVLIYHFLDQLEGLGSNSNAITTAGQSSVLPTSSIERLVDLASPNSGERQALSDKIRNIKDSSDLQEQFSWAVKDGEPLKALDRLEKLIDDLEGFFTPPKADPAAKLALNSLLTTMNLAKLQMISAQPDANSELRGLALLKSTIIEMNARESVFGGEEVDEDEANLNDTVAKDEKNGRSFGTYDNGRTHDVLVEWKEVISSDCPPKHSLFTYKAMIHHRIKNLARLLKADYKPAELHTLDCIGVVTRHLQGGDLEHGMLFKVHGAKSTTMSIILEEQSESLDAGEWYQIARSFSRAVLFLHLAGWLHKGIRSDNVMFFAKDGEDFTYDKPCIVGFEYTREASSAGQTEGVDDDFQFNLYRHPQVQGLPAQNSNTARITKTPFDYRHDIYSLGVVLLELGLKETVELIQQRACLLSGNGNHTADGFRDYLINHEVPKLSSRMGKGYREAVRICLVGDFEVTEDRSIQEAFYLKVVRVLDDYRVN